GFLARAALAAFGPTDLSADTSVFAPAGTQVLDPFPYLPSQFSAIAATQNGITGAGTAGYVGSRRPFLFSANPDGAAAKVTPLAGFDSAAIAPVEPAPPAAAIPTALPVAAPATPPPPRPALATAHWRHLAKHPDKAGSFGQLTLRCTR